MKTRISCIFVIALLSTGLAWSTALAGEKPTCGELINKAQLEKIIGENVKYDAKRKPQCRFKAAKGMANGTVQVFVGGGDNSYQQMLSGAKKHMAPHGKITEPNSMGKKSFEFAGKMYGINMVEIGFLDSSSRHAVLVTLGADWAKMDKLRKLAGIINDKVKKR